MDAEFFRAWITEIAAVVEAQRDHLTQLDSAIGDADHGTNLARGFSAVQVALAAADTATPGSVLLLTGSTLISKVGGASGPLYGTAFRQQSPDAYERLLLDCMLGDPTLFAREDEVEEAWRFCTAILDGWRAHPPDRIHSPNYEAGTWGPEESHAFMARDGRAWRPP